MLGQAIAEVFQSHAGSIEAKMAGEAQGIREDVSIPRWFD